MKRVLLALVFFTAFAAVAWQTQTPALLSVDQNLLDAFSSFRSPSALFFAQAFIFPFDPVPSLILAILFASLCAALGKTEAVSRFLLLVGTILILSKLEKYVFLRVRPTLSQDPLYEGYSFPSAHMLRATGLFFGTLASLPRTVLNHPRRCIGIGLTCVWLTILAGAEILLRRNFPSDMLAGFLLGTAWIALFSGLWDLKGHGPDPAT